MFLCLLRRFPLVEPLCGSPVLPPLWSPVVLTVARTPGNFCVPKPWRSLLFPLTRAGFGTEMGPLQNRKPSSSSIQHIPTPPLQNRKPSSSSIQHIPTPPLQNRKPSSSREHKHTTIIQKKPLQNHAQAKWCFFCFFLLFFLVFYFFLSVLRLLFCRGS